MGKPFKVVIQPITPGHPCRRWRPRPMGMDSQPVDAAQYIAVQTVALDIFADCTNAGMPLQDTLAAIYYSGVHHTLETLKEKGSAA
jgi:hypothetical protein